MTELIRILIADDHYVVRQGLATLLVPRNGMEVVGAAANGRGGGGPGAGAASPT